LVDKVLVVDCLESTQIERVIARSGLARDAVQNIIRAQATRAQDWIQLTSLCSTKG
jgi:dephospho-CoA kinase